MQRADAEIGKLDTYASAGELADAIVSVHAALERSVRLLLRTDAEAPEDARMSALAGDTSLDGVITALRRRDRVSMQLAGRLHESETIARRIAEGNAGKLVVTRDVVREFLGGEKIRVDTEIAERTKRPGVAVGAAGVRGQARAGRGAAEDELRGATQGFRSRVTTSRRRTLPIGLVGSSSMKTTRRGTL